MQPQNKGGAERAQPRASQPEGPAGPWVAPLSIQLHVLDLGPLLMRTVLGGIALEKLHLMSWLFDKCLFVVSSCIYAHVL